MVKTEVEMKRKKTGGGSGMFCGGAGNVWLELGPINQIYLQWEWVGENRKPLNDEGKRQMATEWVTSEETCM